MAVLADGAENKIVLKHPANEPGRETVGVQDLKRVGEGAAGLLERDRVVLGGGTAGQGFAVGTADAAGENAGDLHLVRQPVVELFFHWTCFACGVWLRLARIKIPRSVFTCAMTRCHSPSISRRSKAPRFSPSPSWVDFWERNSRKLMRSLTRPHFHWYSTSPLAEQTSISSMRVDWLGALGASNASGAAGSSPSEVSSRSGNSATVTNSGGGIGGSSRARVGGAGRGKVCWRGRTVSCACSAGGSSGSVSAASSRERAASMRRNSQLASMLVWGGSMKGLRLNSPPFRERILLKAASPLRSPMSAWMMAPSLMKIRPRLFPVVTSSTEELRFRHSICMTSSRLTWRRTPRKPVVTGFCRASSRRVLKMISRSPGLRGFSRKSSAPWLMHAVREASSA